MVRACQAIVDLHTRRSCMHLGRSGCEHGRRDHESDFVTQVATEAFSANDEARVWATGRHDYVQDGGVCGIGKKKSSMELRAGVGCRGRVSIICQTRLARHWGLDPWRRSANRAILAACHIRRMPCNSTPSAGTSPEPTRINPYAHDAHAGKKEIQKSDMRVVTALPRPFWKVTRTSQPVKIRGALPQHSARPTLAQLLTNSPAVL